MLITAGEKGVCARAFSRKLKGEILVFSASGKGVMTDDRTSSRWDVTTGECLGGKLKGTVLSVLPGTISFRTAWEAFFPEGRIVE